MKMLLSDALAIMKYRDFHGVNSRHDILVDSILEKYGMSGRIGDVVEAILSSNSRICGVIIKYDGC